MIYHNRVNSYLNKINGVHSMQKLTLTMSYISSLTDDARVGHHNHVINQRLLNLTTALDDMTKSAISKFDKECLAYLHKIDTTIIEQRDVERAYEMRGVEAIIYHASHGRLYICDGFGGIDSLDGGAVRWRHGVIAKVDNDFTLDNRCDLYDLDVLDFNGYVIESIAKQAGLV